MSERDAQAVRATAYQLLAEDIRAEITSGRLRPGDRLPTEPQLCVRSGLSRSTVREALRLLASQHLIVTTRGVTGGSFVAHPSPDQLADTLSTGVSMLLNTSTVSIDDLLEVRALLEVPVAGLAAANRTEANLSVLHAALFDPVIDELDRMLTLNREFHKGLVAASGNALLELIATPLYQLTNERQLVRSAPMPPDFWICLDSHHREILRCIAARDVDGARAAAAVHVGYLRRSADDAGLTG
ncbi:MAG TPA: FCD domain-containing protein [Micromonosporaceae bacterium]|nr:FCD domain-containing protein [Micromonosporaceae bacterium]